VLLNRSKKDLVFEKITNNNNNNNKKKKKKKKKKKRNIFLKI